MLFPCTPPRIHPCGPHHAPHSSLLKRAADRLAGLAQREHGFPSNRCSSDAVFVLNPQPTLPAPKAHVSVLPDNLPCFAKRKARHLKKLETIQRRLAWPPRRDDIANTEMVRAFCFRCTVSRIATKRIEKLRIARFLSALSSGSFKMRQQHDPHMTRFVMCLFVPC